MEDQLKQGETLFAEGRIDEAAEFFLSAVEKGETIKKHTITLVLLLFKRRMLRLLLSVLPDPWG